MKEFISKNVACIYLDQYAVSGMFETGDTIWNEIKDLLLTGTGNGSIICPLSVEHFWESSQKDRERATLLDTAFLQLAKGYSFKDEPAISAQLLISKIRKNNITPKTWFFTNVSSPLLSRPGNFSQVNTLVKQGEEELKNGMEWMNSMRDIFRKAGWDESIKKEFSTKLMQSAVERLIQQLEWLPAANLNITGTGNIINRLVSIHKMTGPETQSLIQYLKKVGFSEIPTLHIRHTLISYIYAQLKAESLSDQVDISRIATGLPVSDILLTDRKRKNEIGILGLDVAYKTKVYSGTPEDKIAFLENLKQIIS